jgi:hypothetical protein
MSPFSHQLDLPASWLYWTGVSQKLGEFGDLEQGEPKLVPLLTQEDTAQGEHGLSAIAASAYAGLLFDPGHGSGWPHSLLAASQTFSTACYQSIGRVRCEGGKLPEEAKGSPTLPDLLGRKKNGDQWARSGVMKGGAI